MPKHLHRYALVVSVGLIIGLTYFVVYSATVSNLRAIALTHMSDASVIGQGLQMTIPRTASELAHSWDSQTQSIKRLSLLHWQRSGETLPSSVILSAANNIEQYDDTTKITIGELLWQHNLEGKAIEIWKTVAGAEYYFANQGNRYFSENDRETAQNYYHISLLLNPLPPADNAGMFANLCNQALGVADYDGALEYCDKAATSLPSVYSMYNLGKALYYAGRYADARTTLEGAIARYQPTPDVYYFLGLTYRKLGDSRRSFDSINDGLELSPEHPYLGIALGDWFAETGDILQARRQYQAVLDSPSPPEVQRVVKERIERLVTPSDTESSPVLP